MVKVAPGPTVSRGRGRPREFDIDAALDKAARVFRERGYNATSVTDLMEAMGLASGSVYKAFKDKRAVFIAAFNREAEVRGEKLKRIIGTAKPGRKRLRDTLVFYAESSHGVEGQRGCLIVGSATDIATFDIEVAQLVTEALRKLEALIVDLICQGQQDGSISTAIDCKATGRLMLCLLQGMRVVGKTGRTRPEMAVVVTTAMKLL